MIKDVEQIVKATCDIASISCIVATFMNMLPNLAAGASLIWGLIRIWETKTVQKRIRKWRKK
ncbi:hypothetical protein LCGC14_0903490 [marine sediment metagenome]|uniref:Uncharacterized protein n=1 Tax=marine sediment metagenome TaxID=412755 RepID=A0A0F9NVM9_9ZZZZ